MANWGDPFESLALALLYDGVTIDELFPIDFERAFKVMDKVKKHVKVWFTSGNQIMQALTDEEVVIAAAPDGRYHAAKKQGAPIQNVWKDGYFIMSGRAVVKDSPMKEAAMRLINFMCRAEQQAIMINSIGYAGTNKKAVEYVDAKVQKELPTHPDNLNYIYDLMGAKNAGWAIKNSDEISERWNIWLAQ
jgi:putative spermidine/putrescine transport system substrate-binding protein